MARAKILLLLILLDTANAQSQTLYAYQDLSHLYYQAQKDSLKKAWVCPDAFKERDTQKKLREFWDQRTENISNAIVNDDYVHDQDVYNYVAGIVRQITAANPQLVTFNDLV